MKGFQLRISPGFFLLAALVVFFDEHGVCLAALPAIAVHELGHMLAMRLFGSTPVRLTASVSGLSLDYRGELHGLREVISALAGPLSGIVFAYACSYAGKSLRSEYLLLCAGVGAVLSVFNLLPCLPLDGARALSGLTEGCASRDGLLSAISWLTAASVTAAGLYFALCGKGVALCVAGTWLVAACVKRHL